MKVFVMTAFICISTILAYGQESIRWNESRQLIWDDFTGTVNDTSRYDAECFAEIRYNYKVYSNSTFEFEVFASFDKNSSWSRKEMQTRALLKHEQLHFNIAQLFAEKLKKEFESCSYTVVYNSQILGLFNQTKLQYQAMQRQYDEETNHSLNKEKQKQWDDFIYLEVRKTRLSLQLAQNNKSEVSKEK